MCCHQPSVQQGACEGQARGIHGRVGMDPATPAPALASAHAHTPSRARAAAAPPCASPHSFTQPTPSRPTPPRSPLLCPAGAGGAGVQQRGARPPLPHLLVVLVASWPAAWSWGVGWMRCVVSSWWVGWRGLQGRMGCRRSLPECWIYIFYLRVARALCQAVHVFKSEGVGRLGRLRASERERVECKPSECES